jgi:mono/diheme cytochrome c family protein
MFSRWLRWCLMLVVLGVGLTVAVGSASADAPDQLARGAEMFKIRCQPCHGDQGQGLALWRLTWAPEDRNCSSLKCHGLGHPPDGFYMPIDAPPIIGKDTLMHFHSARELYGYISKAMPFDKPGELSSDDYWAVTAFLLQQNGRLPARTRLDASTAASMIINPSAPAAPAPAETAHASSASTGVLVVAAGIVLSIILVLGIFWRRRHLVR